MLSMKDDADIDTDIDIDFDTDLLTCGLVDFFIIFA